MSYIINTGYELYSDSQYTSVSPMALVADVGKKLTINGLGPRTDVSQAVPGLSPLWDTTANKLKHNVVNELLGNRVTFTIKPNGADKKVTIQLKKSDGSLIIEDTVQCVKGAGVAQTVTRYYPIFADALTVADGVEILLSCNDAASVYGAEVLTMIEHLPRFGS